MYLGQWDESLNPINALKKNQSFKICYSVEKTLPSTEVASIVEAIAHQNAGLLISCQMPCGLVGCNESTAGVREGVRHCKL